jgi:hypothetical protein
MLEFKIIKLVVKTKDNWDNREKKLIIIKKIKRKKKESEKRKLIRKKLILPLLKLHKIICIEVSS